MKFSSALAAMATSAAMTVLPTVQAAPLNQPLASNAYISFGGMEWAWASALASFDVDLSYQSQFGWRLPTLQELQGAPTGPDFLFAGGNAVGNTPDPISQSVWAFTGGSNFGTVGAGACASGYFSVSLKNCDYGNAPGSAGVNVVPWSGLPGSQSFSETLVVRAGAVPEPSALALVGLAMAGLAFTRRGARAA